MPPEPSPSPLRVRLTPRAEAAVRSGHPWIYDRSIQDQNRSGLPGELAVVYDRRDRFLAIGLHDPDSPIRIRVLHRGSPRRIDAAFWHDRIASARRLRLDAAVFSDETTGGRCVHGESDGMPGLVADRYGDTLVVKLYSRAWLPHWEAVEAALRQAWEPRHFVLRLSRNLGSPPGFPEGHRGEPGPEVVPFQESGLWFEAQVRSGQKTGFFLDQRENRRRVEAMASGRDVLNAFSFSGAFSVYAARGGARSVTDLDLSAHALDSAARNFRLNAADPRVAAARHERVRADAFRWLTESPPQRYDLVILDPPSLAPRESDRAAALRGYAALVSGGIRVLRRPGLLVAASCSSHVPAEEFFQVVRDTAARGGARFTERWMSGHAADHPAAFPEALYLKALCLEIR
jgi:23S rRNA (cytosine1962-C5)-methyltransferase